nr:Cell wall integrity transcriptional regulator like [Ipomoea batatas]
MPSPPRLSSSPNFTFHTSDRNSGSRTLSNPSEAHEEVNISVSNALVTGGVAGGSEANRINLTDNYMDRPEATDVVCPSEPKLNLKCPLCRGDITGWKVVGEARKYLNLKPRNCSRESCSFVGNYRELRHHARRVHPTARPTDVDPLRQRAWRSLEEQREYDDIISAIRTAMPGAMVFGDYVIENGDRLSSERGTGESGRLMSTLFLFQMIGSMDTISELRSDRSRTLSRHRRSSGSLPRRRFLWESILSKIFSQLTSPSSQKPASLSEGRSISISFSSYRQGYALIQTK